MEQDRVSDTDWKLTNGCGYILNLDRGHAAVARLNLQFYLWKAALQFNIHPSIKSLPPRNATIAQVASESALPPNVRVRYLNTLEDIPEDLVGKPIIRNLGELLKPGGHLQWDELDTVNISIKKVNSDLPTTGLDELRKWSWAGRRHDWIIKLADFVAEEGFVDVKVDFVGDGLELARASNDQRLKTAEKIAEGLAKLGDKETAAEYFRIV
ncbi:hypothetical protein CSOJ01_07883 [Colletotrichum sojae]|uniref:Uncharacterized protein n=1 Tax=Colletotrichum sojae TaxID=2175907 RepID=A0A8H6J890_9PEZI|nr:hypothetical protein CSOJ01_07883 [Colletotrichum sojae]